MRGAFALGLGVLGLLSTSCEKSKFGSLLESKRLAPIILRESPGLREAILRELEAQLVVEEPEEPTELAPGEAANVAAVEPAAAEESLVRGSSSNGAVDEDAEEEGAEARLSDERANVARERPRLASIAHETWIYAEPKPRARRIGYLRGGAVVPRSVEPVGTAGCKGGWYRVGAADKEEEPKGAGTGFVCLGRTASLNPYHPVVEALDVRPKLDGIPYDYVMGRIPGPPMYSRVPTREEQAREEPDLSHHLKKVKSLARDPSFVAPPEPGPMHDALLYGRSLPRFNDEPATDALVLGRAGVRSGFALVGQFEDEGRQFGVTTELRLIPLDRTRWIQPSTFHGLALDEQTTLPVGFVMKKKAHRYSRDERGRMTESTATSYREAIALTDRREGGYREAKDGSWVREQDLRVVGAMTRAPVWAREGKRWLDVSILEQSLVAYEGQKPIYVTLVSTGAGGLGDPKTTHATVQGAFLIHTKHITTTMDGDETGDEFDLRDVPFVQYFNEGYALHAAYWHDDFGTPRSHGCVNLAPTDAAWLFQFTTPDVPKGWHGALSLKRGTVVYTHP
jgi:hypothetical protein